MSIGIRHSITSGQCRAARALLDITQPELRPQASGCQRSLILKNLAATSRERRSTRCRRLWKRLEFNSSKRMVEDLASGFKDKTIYNYPRGIRRVDLNVVLAAVLANADRSPWPKTGPEDVRWLIGFSYALRPVIRPCPASTRLFRQRQIQIPQAPRRSARRLPAAAPPFCLGFATA